MGNQEQGVDFKKYITILKRVTIFTQFLPFIYTSLYIVTLLIYPVISDQAAIFLDSLFYISPAFMVGMLIMSRLLHLCKWHRAACVIPLISQIPVFIDQYIISLSQVEAIIANSAVVIMAILLIIAAYNVFFK